MNKIMNNLFIHQYRNNLLVEITIRCTTVPTGVQY